MEFSSRGFQRSPQPAAAGAGAPHTPENRPAHKKAIHKVKESKLLSILWLVFVASIVVLILAIIFSFSAKSSESSLVNKDKYQAVFLDNGQAYFGKIKTLNNSYIDLRDIYYLYNGSNEEQNTAQNLSLVKLGTELHCPEDRMVIYRDQVSFWENLNDDGKVVTAIKDWKKQNPNGQKCSQTNQQNTQQSTSPQQTGTETGSETPPTQSGSSDQNGNSSSNPTGGNTPTNTGNGDL